MAIDDTLERRKKFGQRLQAARKAASLSLRGLAAASGVDHSNIGQIEKAERDPQLSTVLELAAALAIPVRDLFPPEEAE